MKQIYAILCLVLLLRIPLNSAITVEDDFSYGLYAKVLDEYVDGFGRVDYERLKTGKQDLVAFIRNLAGVHPADLNSWSDNARIAFWVNTYNALTLKVIIDNYPIKSSFFRSLIYPKNSIRQISGVWDKITFSVLGERYTLDRIEHEVLRKKFSEPRIHMALVCASKSCPALRQEPYEADKLDFQLETQTRIFLSDSDNYSINKDTQTVYLSSIFKWFGEDFVDVYKPESGFVDFKRRERAVLYFVSLHVPENDKHFLKNGTYDIRYTKYDWSLNDRTSQ